MGTPQTAVPRPDRRQVGAAPSTRELGNPTRPLDRDYPHRAFDAGSVDWPSRRGVAVPHEQPRPDLSSLRPAALPPAGCRPCERFGRAPPEAKVTCPPARQGEASGPVPAVEAPFEAREVAEGVNARRLGPTPAGGRGHPRRRGSGPKRRGRPEPPTGRPARQAPPERPSTSREAGRDVLQLPRQNRLAQPLLSQEGPQPFRARRAPLPDPSEPNRCGLQGVLPWVGLAIRVHRVDLEKPAAILSHVRHHAKTSMKLKDIARVDPMEGNKSARGPQASRVLKKS